MTPNRQNLSLNICRNQNQYDQRVRKKHRERSKLSYSGGQEAAMKQTKLAYCYQKDYQLLNGKETPPSCSEGIVR
jgi:hypothetical protein